MFNARSAGPFDVERMKREMEKEAIGKNYDEFCKTVFEEKKPELPTIVREIMALNKRLQGERFGRS